MAHGFCVYRHASLTHHLFNILGFQNFLIYYTFHFTKEILSSRALWPVCGVQLFGTSGIGLSDRNSCVFVAWYHPEDYFESTESELSLEALSSTLVSPNGLINGPKSTLFISYIVAEISFFTYFFTLEGTVKVLYV